MRPCTFVPLLVLCLSSSAPALGQAGPNLARGKPTRQSSTGFGGVAERATDGRPDGSYNAGSVTHTNQEAGWLEVDLGEPIAVGTVVLHNRTDCCTERLVGARVELAAQPCATSAPLAAQTVAGPEAKAVFTFPDAPRARYLCVRHLRREFLSIAEIEAYGPTAAASPAAAAGEFDGPPTLDCAPPKVSSPVEDPDASYLVAPQTRLWKPGSKIAVCYLSNFGLRPANAGDGFVASFENLGRDIEEAFDDPSKKEDFAFVKKYADEWTRHANISFDWIGACTPDKAADVRIGTDRKDGTNWWSIKFGGPSHAPCAGQSCVMNLNLVHRSPRIVRHEFGHVLGLEHEQKNPKVAWQWDWDALRRDGKDVDQYKALGDGEVIFSTELDVYSVMMYRIPYRYIVGGKAAWLAAYPGFPLDRRSEELSEVDRTYVAKLYPKLGDRDTSFNDAKPRVITFYKHTGFGGEARTFITDMSNLREVGFNRTVSSVMGNGALYQGPNYTGNCIDVVDRMERMPAGWNDSISSVRPGGTCTKVMATVYKDTGYGGGFVQVLESMASLGGMNDEISSIRLNGAKKLALYSDAAFMGICTQVSGDVVRTGELPVGNDRISSIAVDADCPTATLVLHQDSLYRGKTLTVTSDMPNLKNAGFNDAASSVRLLTGRAALYRDTEYRGACIEVTGDIPQLSKTPVGNDSVSSIRVGRGC